MFQNRFAICLAFLTALNVIGAAAEPAISLSLDRTSIYLGESVVAEVSVSNWGGTPPQPEFRGGSPASVEMLAPRSFSQTQTTIINGKRDTVTLNSTVFTCVITPTSAGDFKTGEVVVGTGAKKLSAPSRRVQVIAPKDFDFVALSLRSPDKSVTVEGRFKIEVEIGIRALPPPNENYEPWNLRDPLKISAEFLQFSPSPGLKPPDASEVLNPLLAQNASQKYFTINNYQTQGSLFPSASSLFGAFGSPFQDTPAHFRPNPEKREISGTNWWFYSFSAEYTALEEGSYTFGPLSLKGRVFDAADASREPSLEEIFAIAGPVEIKVLPPPEEGRPAWFCGGSGRSLSVKATLDATKCKVGDPLILTLELAGDVNFESVKPPMPSKQPGMPECFRFYDEHAESETFPGGKRYRYRMRPLKAGTLELPAIRTAYFDTVKGEYITVESDALPLQVEATTQISVVSDEEGEGGAEAILPEGMIWASADDFSVSLPIAGKLDIERLVSARWLLLAFFPPLAFVLAWSLRGLVRILARRMEATSSWRAAKRSRRRFRRIVAHKSLSMDDIAKCATEARRFAAALLSCEPSSLTARDVLGGLAGLGVPAGLAKSFADDFAAIEEMPFSHVAGTGGEAPAASPRLAGLAAAMDELTDVVQRGAALAEHSVWKVVPHLFAVMASATLLVISAVTKQAPCEFLQDRPDAFDWDRAQNSLAASQTATDFAASARRYMELLESGAATAPLCNNLGIALLMSGEPQAAVVAFDKAAAWRGLRREIRLGRIAARQAGGGGRELLPQFYIFAWHYMLPLVLRIAIVIAAWWILWISGICRLAGMVQGRARRFWTCSAAASAAILLAFAASVAISRQRISEVGIFPPTSAEQADSKGAEA